MHTNRDHRDRIHAGTNLLGRKIISRRGRNCVISRRSLRDAPSAAEFVPFRSYGSDWQDKGKLAESLFHWYR